MLDTLTVAGTELVFETRPGVFAQYGIDYGSQLLLEAVEVPQEGNVLDLGCGCGVLGISIAKLASKTHVYLVDSDIRAVRLSEDNVKRNQVENVKVLLSDVVADLPSDLTFDLVVSNPPTHQGREVLISFIEGAYSVLKKGKPVYFVVNRMTSVLDRMKEVFGNAEKLKRRKGYIVSKSIKF